MSAKSLWSLTVILAALISGGPALAQSADTVRDTCDQHLVPAHAKAESGRSVDCRCVAGFLIGRYGASDAEIIVRMFAAAAAESREQLEAVRAQYGDAIGRVLQKVGKFQDLGREMDRTCPVIKKP